MALIISRKLTPLEAKQVLEWTLAWFAANPRRRVCHTDLFDIRRGHEKEDIEAHTITKEK